MNNDNSLQIMIRCVHIGYMTMSSPYPCRRKRVGRYRGRNPSSGSGHLLAHRAPLYVLEKCAPLSDCCLVSRAHGGFTSSPQMALFGAHSETPHTAAPFSILPNPAIYPPLEIQCSFDCTQLTDHILGLGHQFRLQDRWYLV